MNPIERSAGIRKIETLDLKQRMIASKTFEGWNTIPHIAGEIRPNVTHFLNLLEEYKKIRAEKYPNLPKITINNVILKIIASGIQKAPHLNSILEYDKKSEGGNLKILDKVNITIPVMINELETTTLVVPDVLNKTVDEISLYVMELKRKLKNTDLNELSLQTARLDTINKVKKGQFGLLNRIIRAKIGAHKIKEMSRSERKIYYSIPESDWLQPSDINTGSIVVTNLGSVFRDISGEVSLIDIIPSNTFAVGLNAVRKVPIVETKDGIDTIQIISVLPIIYSFDHRSFDFGHVIPFLKEINRILTNPIGFFESEFSDFQDHLKINKIYQETLLYASGNEKLLEMN